MKKHSYSLQLFAFILAFLIAGFYGCKKTNDENGNQPQSSEPTITAISPKNPAVGDGVTITGKSFGVSKDDVKVSIGSQTITVSTVTDTEIKFNVPSGISSGTLVLTVKGKAATNNDPQGGTISIQASAAPIITALNPVSGKTGDIITVTGNNFSSVAGDNLFKFNGIAAVVKTATLTTLTVEVPSGATTGAVTLSVKSGAVVSGPSFTVASGNTGGTSVDYIQASAGTANFSKIATAAAQVTSMVVDRRNNILYYVAGGLIYKMALSGGNPALLTTDSKAVAISNITMDGAGNVYAHTGGIAISVFKITPDGSVTQLGSNVSFTDNDRSFFVDASNKVWLKHNIYLDNGAAVDTHDNFGLSLANVSLSNGVSWNGDLIYIPDGKTITTSAATYYFYKADLKNRTAVKLDFDIANMFKTDDPNVSTTSGNQLNYFRFGLDDTENLYAILPHTYISGQLTKTFMIRKARAGSSSSSLITTFKTKFDLTTQVYGPEGSGSDTPVFAVDGTGNMYLVFNLKDIIRITQ